MFVIRASFLLMVIVSMSWSEGAGEDRIGILLSMMADMGKRVGSLTDSVKQIYRMEEETAEHMLKTEDRVSEIAQKEGGIEKKVGNIDTQMAQMKTEMAQVKIKVDNVDNGVAFLNWRLIGHGYQKSLKEQVSKYSTTLHECIAFCTKKRQESGAAWNGFLWYLPTGQCFSNKNDVGHAENKDNLHFKV